MNVLNNNQKIPLERITLTSSPTVVITEKIKKQIDFLHSRVGAKEWSGELITSEEGTIDNPNAWKIICEDIYLVDVETPTHTKYIAGEKAFKAVDILELFDKYPDILEGKLKNHHVHSHHNMGAFFSPTDWDNLEHRACSSNYFLMLVVDFRGTYEAKMAFKAKMSSGTGRKLTFANNEDGFEDIILTGDRDKDVLVVMDCKIEWAIPALAEKDEFENRLDYVLQAIEKDESEQKRLKQLAFNMNIEGEGSGARCNKYPPSPQQSAFDWDDEYCTPTSKNKNKKISDMTDKQFGAFNDDDAEIVFDEKDANIFLNSAIEGEYTMNTNGAVDELFKKDKMFKNAKQAKDYAFVISSRIRDLFDDQFPEYGVESTEYAILADVILKELRPYKYNRLIKFLSDEIGNHLLLIEQQNNDL